MLRKNLKNRMMFAFGSVIVGVILIAEVFFLYALQRYYYDTVEQTMIQESKAHARYYQQFANDSLPILAQRISDDQEKLRSNVDFNVIDRNYHLLINSTTILPDRVWNMPDVEEALNGRTGIWRGRAEHDSGDAVIAVSHPIWIDGEIAGVLRYRASIVKVNQELFWITSVSIMVAILLLYLAIMLSNWIAKRIVRPISELTMQANQIAQGNFLVSPVKHTKDEVGVLSETMHAMSVELHKNEQIKNEFISSVSHELRTPLTSINGWLETLQADDTFDEQEAKYGMEIMQKEAQRLTKLVENLLDFSRYQAGKITLEKENVSLTNLMIETKKQYYVQSKKQQVPVILKSSEDITIFADHNRIKQVLINVIDNALKFTPAGGQISLTLNKQQNFASVAVMDTGCGISASELKHITKRFYKGNSKKKGTGLGLAICKEIIHLHGGNLSVTSELGKGTTVTFTLPLSDN